MFKFSCFADEILPDLKEQIAEVERLGRGEMRRVWLGHRRHGYDYARGLRFPGG